MKRHESESLTRTLAVTLVAIVAVVLGLSAVGYVGEAIVKAQHAMRADK